MVEEEGRAAGNQAAITEIRLQVAAAVRAIHRQLERIQQVLVDDVEQEER